MIDSRGSRKPIDGLLARTAPDCGACAGRSLPARFRKILIMGLPGVGKTTLTRVLAPRLAAVVFNADEVRANINNDLGFSLADRIEHARRMGWLCDQIVTAGGIAIADFVCPTPETRSAFGDAFVVWIDRIKEGRFEDTNRLFVPPQAPDFCVPSAGLPEMWADEIIAVLESKHRVLDIDTEGDRTERRTGHG